MNFFKIYTLGCKVNQVDSRELKNFLIENGWQEASKNQKVNLIIVNSCSVTMTAISKTRKLITRLKKNNVNAKIILTGCYPRVYLQKGVVSKQQKLDKKMILGADEISLSVSEIKRTVLRDNKQLPGSQKKNGSEFKISPSFRGGRARYYLKIQDGCNQFCSYCVIPYARDKMISKSEDEVVQELKEAIKVGYQEIILCGIHLGRFSLKTGGNGIGDGEDLARLLKQLIKIKGLGRIRLSSIEVNEVSDELIGLMQKSEKICSHLHISLQSGSDKILKLMRRPYTKRDFLLRVSKIKKMIPEIALTTDVIVGFPGETEQDFQETIEFIEKVGFAKVHVFSFSSHEKSLASRFSNQVDLESKKQRAYQLRKVSERLEQSYLDSMRGKVAKIVIEKIDGQRVTGRSEYYHLLTTETKRAIKRGQLLKVRF